MNIQPAYRHTYASHPVPEYIFHIGPSPENTLSHLDDFYRRVKDVEPLLDPGHVLFHVLSGLLEGVLGSPVESLQAEICQGGWGGKTCPDFCIGTLYSRTRAGFSIFSRVNRLQGQKIAYGLMTMLQADWVVCWHWPAKAFQVVCERQAITADAGGASHEQ